MRGSCTPVCGLLTHGDPIGGGDRCCRGVGATVGVQILYLRWIHAANSAAEAMSVHVPSSSSDRSSI